MGEGGQNAWQSDCLNFPLETTLSPDATLMGTAAARSPEAEAGPPRGPFFKQDDL